MEVVNLNVTSEAEGAQPEIIRALIMNHKGDFSIDLLFDIFQNLILDCKSLAQCNSHKYLNNFYQLYSLINERLETLRVKVDDFNMLKVIGQGASGQVHLVRHKYTGHLYALKILNKAQMKNQDVSWKEERDILTKVDSRWIVKLHYAFQDPRRLYMAMEYMPGGNLVNWMGRLDEVSEADVCFYAAEIVLAVSALHEHNFVHRDLKPDNMLLDIRGHIKLADFGSCIRVDPETKYVVNTRAVGTPDYISPEVLLSQSNNSKYGCEVDWWALGVILYEIFYGDPPFYSDTLITTYGKIMTHEQSLTFPPDDQVSAAAVSIMKGLICDSSLRLGIKNPNKNIKSHIFFNSPNFKWNWDNIHEFEAPFVPNLQNDSDTAFFEFTEDDDSDLFNGDNSKELTSKVFTGDNLQFSGFSFSDLFKVNHVSAENIKDQSVTSSIVGNEKLSSKVHFLSKENQDIKYSFEKLTIERKDLEIQFKTIMTKYKNEETISKKLQSDYSDLISKHGLCQQKLSKLEEEKHKLCADLTNLQNASTDESRRLVSQIEHQQNEFNALTLQLSDSENECRKYKLHGVKLENDMKHLQKKYDSMELELSQSKHSKDQMKVPIKQNMTVDRLSLELKDLRLDYEGKLKDLECHMMENQLLKKSVSAFQREMEDFKICLSKVEGQLSKEIDNNKKLSSDIKDNNYTIENLNVQVDGFRKKLESSSKYEKDLSQRLSRIIKARLEDKQHFDNEIEDQRKKLSNIISTKTTEIQELKKSQELLVDENSTLKSEVKMEKARCSVLVDKINEIITGKSTSAREMMLGEDMKSGFLGKKSGRYYNQVLTKNKKLESMYQQLEKDTLKKEKEYKIQLETLSREKDHLETENNSLKNNIAYYENLGTNDTVHNRGSGVTFNSQSSFDSGFTIEAAKMTSTPTRNNKPPKLSLMNISFINNATPSLDIMSLKSVKMDKGFDEPKSDLSFRQNSRPKQYDPRRLSITETSLSIGLCLHEGQLDVNVKTKGKKMSWDRRFVKIDSQNIVFYDQALDNCLLKLPLSSLVLVRRANSADVIHAKKTEMSRIFQIIYDKNSTLYSDVLRKKSMSSGESTTSINTLESNETELNDTVIQDIKQGAKRGSAANFFPKFGFRNKLKNKAEELTIMTVNANAVFLRGHVFQPYISESRVNCDLCKTPLLPLSSNTLIVNKDLRVVVDNSVSMMMQQRDNDSLSSTVDPTKCYSCFHCSINVHGCDLNQKMNACKESVAIQLCRASSEEQLLDWIKCLDNIMKSRQMSVSTPGPVRSDFKSRCATLN